MSRIRFLAGLLAAALAVGVTYAVNHHRHLRQCDGRERPPGGAITGRVLDEQEQPVAGAEVMAFSDSTSVGRVPTAYTDKEGAFRLERLAPGTYTMSVAKKEDGYPPTYIPLYSEGPATDTQVTLGEQQAISGVTLRLGPQAARLTGRLLNAATKKPIRNLQDTELIVRRADAPDHFLSTGPDLEGNFSILVPPVPIILEVTAPGFEKWQNRADAAGEHAAAIQMERGEKRSLTISLRPGEERR